MNGRSHRVTWIVIGDTSRTCNQHVGFGSSSGCNAFTLEFKGGKEKGRTTGQAIYKTPDAPSNTKRCTLLTVADKIQPDVPTATISSLMQIMAARPSLRLALAFIAISSFVAAGPCDIYADGNTPCVAAHGTTRALYSAYSGPLYQVQRGSDNTTTEISPLSAGGVADADAQDTFCDGTTCLISVIYDQSGNGNDLTRAPPGGAATGPESDGYDNLASATGAPVTLDGSKAYGVFISPGTGYRNDETTGVATGDEPEGMYAVFDGTHYNDGCCFDYGNAETSDTDTGNGHMEAIYFGDNTFWGSGAGDGPWIMADLENGLFSGEDLDVNTGDPSISYRFLTAIIKGEADHWAIRGANAASGSLSTYYDGVRPDATGYDPMSKEGSILLGIGGDNSISGQGTLYEGVVTSGYPSDDTEASVQV